MPAKFYNDDSLSILSHVPEGSVDLVVTDPPYSISMDTWDKVLPDKRIWENCFKVLKPGGFLLAMGATRLYHRLACDLEDSGFQIKECLCWMYPSGFPRGRDIGKEIARQNLSSDIDWTGYNTALKPSWEAIVLAERPLDGTYAENVLKYKVGGINIDECRIPYESEEDKNSIGSFEHFTQDDFGDDRFFSANSGGKKQVNIHPNGRYPANLLYFDSLFPGQYDKIFMIPKPSGMEKYELTHSTVKPFRLFHRLISMFSPKPSVTRQPVVVLDPFAGTGTCAVACMDLGRDFIGFEKDEKSYEEAKRRIDRIKKPKIIFES